MRAVEVLDNLKGFNAWEYSSYSMNKEEADVCIEALKVLINLDQFAEKKEKNRKDIPIRV